MNIVNASLLCLALPALTTGSPGIAGAAAVPGVQQAAPEPGAATKYKFKRTPLNSLGVKSIADLRGKPVLVALWGSQNPADDWVDDVVVWQKQYGSDLAVVMIETQGADLEKVERLALKKRWHNSRLMWTTEVFLNRDIKSLPSYALLGIDGSVIMKGETGMAGMNFMSRRLDEIEDGIVEQIRLRVEGPDGTPKSVTPIWSQFAKGDIAEAFAAARALSKGPAGEGSDTVAAAARAARKFFKRRIDQRLVRCAALLDEGRLTELEEELEGLEDQLDDEPKLAARYTAIATSLHSEENASERAAAKALTKIQSQMQKKGLNKAALRSLERMARKHNGTKSAVRALRWVSLAAKS